MAAQLGALAVTGDDALAETFAPMMQVHADRAGAGRLARPRQSLDGTARHPLRRHAGGEDRFRGRRIGERLLRRVARECRKDGGAYLRLSVDSDNETAKAFYERLGIGWSSYEQVQKIVGDAFFAFADAPEE